MNMKINRVKRWCKILAMLTAASAFVFAFADSIIVTVIAMIVLLPSFAALIGGVSILTELEEVEYNEDD